MTSILFKLGCLAVLVIAYVSVGPSREAYTTTGPRTASPSSCSKPPPSSIHRHHGSSGELNMVKHHHFSQPIALKPVSCYQGHLTCLVCCLLLWFILFWWNRGGRSVAKDAMVGCIVHHRMDYSSFLLWLPCGNSHVETLVGFAVEFENLLREKK